MKNLQRFVIKANPDPDSPHNRHVLKSKCEAGALIRLCTGRYAETEVVEKLSKIDRHCLRAIAFATRSKGTMLSHGTAVLMHELFLPERLIPDIVTLRGAHRTRLKDPELKVYRYKGVVDVVKSGDLMVTSIPQTAIDFAREAPFMQAVCLIDEVRRRHGVEISKLKDLLEAQNIHHFAPKVHRALDASVGNSDSWGESITRLVMTEFGLPEPQLQFPVKTSRGTCYVDFAFPQQKLFVEFDGRMKYRGGFGEGSKVLEEEKDREDLIRAQTGYRMKRITWEIACNSIALAHELLPYFPNINHEGVQDANTKLSIAGLG